VSTSFGRNDKNKFIFARDREKNSLSLILQQRQRNSNQFTQPKLPKTMRALRKKAPHSKLQHPEKLQAPTTKPRSKGAGWGLVLRVSLELGGWCLELLGHARGCVAS
jgi:hypothetical protein